MRYGEVQKWQVEVRGLFKLYRDSFGDLQGADTFDDPDSTGAQHLNEEYKCQVYCICSRNQRSDSAGATSIFEAQHDGSFGWTFWNLFIARNS